MTTKTKLKGAGDLVIHVESLEYTTVSAILRNTATITTTFSGILGAPVVAGSNGADFNMMVAGGEANAVGLVMKGPDSLTLNPSSNSGRVYQVLKNPPAIINQNIIKATDPAGAALTVATIVTALRALKFEVRTEPVKQTVQST